MTSLGRILAVAGFEARLARRMWRVWLLAILGLLVGLGLSAQRLAMHYFFGSWSGSFSFLTRDLYVQNGVLFMSVMMSLVGIFYSFDWRRRDEAARFAEAFDASGVSRLEYAWGKFLGLATTLVAPFTLLFLAQVITGFATGVTLPVSVYLHAYLEVMPLVVFTPVAVSFGVAALTRSPALGVISSLAWFAFLLVIFGIHQAMGIDLQFPEVLGVALVGAPTVQPIHSSFVGYSHPPLLLLQLLGSSLFLAFFISLGAFCGESPSRSAAAGLRKKLVLAGLGGGWALVCGVIAMLYLGESGLREDIVAAERQASAESNVVVFKRDLHVTLEPGAGTLAGEARLEVRNDTDAPLASAAFRLNNGLKVSEIEGASAFEHDLTVLRVTLNSALEPGASTALTFHYEGEIEAASIDAESELAVRAEPSAMERGVKRFLGSVPAYLEGGAVALGIDAAWYPDTAFLFGLDYPALPTRSFAPGSLTVKLPEGWKAASVGALAVDSDGVHRFESSVPVPGVSLNAAVYEERSVEVAGVLFRLLFHPEHSPNVEFFEPAAHLIASELEKRLAGVELRTGLNYPHPEFTLVEVPQLFAAHSAGWSTPNRMGAPGVVMMRESGLFLSNFGYPLKKAREDFLESTGQEDTSSGVKVTFSTGDGETHDGGVTVESEVEAGDASDGAEDATSEGEAAQSEGLDGDDESTEPETEKEDEQAEPDFADFDEPQARMDILTRFIGTDWTGGDLERLAFRSAWDHRLQATGMESPVMGPALSSFMAELALERPVLDTPDVSRIFMGGGEGWGAIAGATFSGGTASVAEAVVNILCDVDDVYRTMQVKPLNQLDPAEDSLAFLGVLFRKGRLPLAALQASLGREAWNRAMTGLLSEHEGGSFVWDDLKRAVLTEAPAEERDGLAVLFDNWMEGTALPGFVVGKVEMWRLEGEEEQWQLVARVSNRGDAPGTARFTTGKGDDARELLFSVPAGEDIELGLVASVKPSSWELSPFLSLNRTPPKGSVSAEEKEARPGKPFVGVRPARPLSQLPPIVVDNSDEGFTVKLKKGEEVRFGEVSQEDGGLRLERISRIRRKGPSEWARWRTRSRWHEPYGLFDLTAAVKRGTEEGAQPAKWRTVLPSAGRYRVEAFLPSNKSGRGRNLAPTYEFNVVGLGGGQDVAIRLDGVEAGWNDLGRFEFDVEAAVELKDLGEGALVADAVRFIKEDS